MGARPFAGHGWSLCSTAFVIALAVPLASPGAVGDARITASFQDEPLGEVLEAVGELAGWTIDLINAPSDARLDLTLTDASFEAGLAQILEGRNYTLIWSPDNEVAVFLLEEESADRAETGEAKPPTTSPSHEQISLFPDGEELVPPDYPGGQGLTDRDIDHYTIFRTPRDPSEEELVPPSAPGEIPLTQGDLEFLSATRVRESPEEQELVPPEGDEAFGLTLAELKAISAARPVEPSSEIELVPPDEFGRRGLTLGEFLSIKQPEGLTGATKLDDIIPPD